MTFQHRAGVRAYTASCDFARSCVFSKQSLGPGFCDPIELQTFVLHPTGAFLLPKLRNHFAEFLNQSFLARLSILYLSTCVGLGYGYHTSSLEAFLGGLGVQWLRLTRLGITPRSSRSPDLPRLQPTCLPQVNHRLGPLTLPRHPIADLIPAGSVGPEGLSLANWIRSGRACGSTGISTCYPSITPRGLTLGPD